MPVPHVMPMGDRVDHEATRRCVCGPVVQRVTRTDGSRPRVYVHHRLDRG